MKHLSKKKSLLSSPSSRYICCCLNKQQIHETHAAQIKNQLMLCDSAQQPTHCFNSTKRWVLNEVITISTQVCATLLVFAVVCVIEYAIYNVKTTCL